MRIKKEAADFLTAFFICTTCITFLEGILGMLFFPDMKLGYDAFFSPPFFAFFSVLFGLVTKSKKELTVKQVWLRRGIHLLLIEGLVLGLNYSAGAVFEPVVLFVLILSIAVVFAAVYAIMWVNDRRSAAMFNEKLKQYQSKALE
ncbi:MAG: DUF3021 family protein [Lachnospiraceae bacterium]|nr:DUF3021 family protein [Lachnospiraceae bacterium]